MEPSGSIFLFDKDRFWFHPPSMEICDPTKAHLIHLSGQGDVDIKLVNAATMEWVLNGGEAPDAQIDALTDPGEDREEVARWLREMTDGSSPDNDRALNARADDFGGETFSGGTMKELFEFLNQHGLELGEEYEGYIY